MRKHAIYLLMAVLFVSLLGCSNNDNSEKTQRPATFLHNVVDAGELYLDGDERSYGRISYGSFGNGILLDEGDWDLKIKDVNDEDSTDTTTILDTSFTVNDYANANIFAISGSQSDKSVKLHALKSAIDEESSGYTSDANADDSLIYINVANIHPGYKTIKVYLLQGDETIETATADAEIDYGSYSAAIKLTTAKQRIVVVDSNGETVFESGEKTLQDAFQQMLIFAESSSDTKAFRAYYFYGSTSNSKMWGDGAGTSSVRIFNAVYNERLETVVTDTPESENQVITEGLGFAKVSETILLPVDQYDFYTDFAGSMTSFQPSYYLSDGMLETVILTGRIGVGEEIKTLKLTNEQRIVKTKALVTFVNLGYKTDTDSYTAYNVHLTTGTNVDHASRTPELEGINYLQFGQIEKTVEIGDDVGKVYILRVMNETNNATIASIELTIKSGSSYQIALVEKGSGVYELVDIDKAVQ